MKKSQMRKEINRTLKLIDKMDKILGRMEKRLSGDDLSDLVWYRGEKFPK